MGNNMRNMKNIENVEIEGEDMINAVRIAILLSIKNGTIRADKKFVYFETQESTSGISIPNFMFIFEDQNRKAYEMLESILSKDEISDSMMQDLYHWTNPFFEDIGDEAMIKFKKDFTERLKNDKDYLEYIKSLAIENATTRKEYRNLEKRKDYIERFTELGIFGEREKIKLEYYMDAPISKIEAVCKKEDLTLEERAVLVGQVYQYERELDKKKEPNKKRKYNSRIIGALNLVNGITIVDMYLQDGINTEEFIRTKVQKADILQIPYVGIMDFMENKNSQMPDRLKITSMDLVNAYGRTLSGNTIYKFVIYGYIEPQDFIEVYDINKTLSRVDYDEKDIFEDEELKAFYTPEKLVDMKKSGLITPRFIEKYLELEEFDKNPAIFRGKSLELVEEILKENQENFEGEVLDFFDMGFCDLETSKEIITPKYLETSFKNGKIDRENLFEFYKKGFINEDFIVKYYTDREILDLYEAGKIPKECLRAVKDPDNIIQYFCDDKIGYQDITELYLKSNNFSVKDLSDAFELKEEGQEYDISAFIDETTPFEKIKELFSNLLIDYSLILRLKNQGILNEEQFSEIKAALDTREFFQEIKDGKRYTVITSREREGGERVRPLVPRYKDEEDYSDEMKLISTILERDVEDEDYGLIESYNAKGKPTSLNNYRIFGNEELDGIVILQKSKKGNAVFVMNALQMMYFLKGKENENGEFEVQDRMKDKAYLKTIEGVEVVEHSKFFGSHLIEACSRVSEKVSEKVKVSDKKYRDDVAEMVEDMLDKYLMEKGKSR